MNTEKKSPAVEATIKQEKDELTIEFGNTSSILTKDSLIINVK